MGLLNWNCFTWQMHFKCEKWNVAFFEVLLTYWRIERVVGDRDQTCRLFCKLQKTCIVSFSFYFQFIHMWIGYIDRHRSSISVRSEVYSIQHLCRKVYQWLVIHQVGRFLSVLRYLETKTYLHDVAEFFFLKVAFNIRNPLWRVSLYFIR
jgi:hypothetical protein